MTAIDHAFGPTQPAAVTEPERARERVRAALHHLHTARSGGATVVRIAELEAILMGRWT